MKIIRLTYLFYLVSVYSFSQVGIGNTNPQAVLDISASSSASPSNADGILIPRMNNFPTNPGATRDGMLIFYTGSGAAGKGFYYWNQTTTSWTSVTGTKQINDLIDGKSDNDGSDDGSSLFLGIDAGANDDSTHNYNVGIGFEALQSNISSWGNTAIGHESMQNNTSGTNNTATGAFTLLNNISGGNNAAFGNATLASNTSGHYNTAIGHGSMNDNIGGDYNTALGYWSLLNNDSGAQNVALGASSGYTNSTGDSNIFIGYQSGYFETGSDKLYIENSNVDSNNALIYGEFDNNILRTNGELQIGNPTTTGYSFPTINGTSGQILTTDGSGNLSFQNPISDADWHEANTTSNTNNINDDIFTQGNVGIGNSTPNASLDINYTGTQSLGIDLNYSQSNTAGAGYGLNITAETAGTVGIVGSAITVQNSNSANTTFGMGIVNTANGNSNLGISSEVTGSGTNNTGLYTNATGASNENIGISASATGGITNWAGYFGQRSNTGSGNVFVNDLLEVDKAFRYTDGNEAAGYVLRSDTNGDANWADPSTIFTNTQNTLDQAYDEGGSGFGRSINIDSGSLEFIANGTDSFTTITTNSNGQSGIQINTSGNISSGSGVSSESVEINNTVNTNSSFANNYGVFSKMTVNGTVTNGTNAGFRTWFLPAGSAAGSLYGFYSYNQNGGSGEHYGLYSIINNNGNGTKYGIRSRIEGSGTGTKYGIHSIIDSATGGTHYALYAIATQATGYAGYFAGRVEFGHGFTNRYFMPGSDGTNGQVMTTDGTGNVTFQDATINTDNQQIDNFNFNTTTNILSLEMEDDGQTAQTVDLSTLQDGIGTDDQQIDNIGLSGTVLGISLEDDGVAPNTVDLSSINTDNQQIDNFSFDTSTNVLTLEVEDDGQAAQTLDLSSLNPIKAIARITMNTDQTETGSGTTKVNFDTRDFDVGNHFNLINDNYVVPTTGKYRVTGQITMSSSTDTGNFAIRIRINNFQQRRSEFNHHGNGAVVRQVTSILSLTAGDTIDVSFARPAVGATIESDTRDTFFEIEQL